MDKNRKKLWTLFIALILTEVVYRPIATLEGNGAFMSIEYNILLNVHGFLFAVAFMMGLDLYFLARKECVTLGLYRITRHKGISLIKQMKEFIRKIFNDKRAITSSSIIGLAVSFFLVAIMGPIAIGTIANTTTTNWDASVVTIFQVVLPIIWVVGVALKYLPGKE